MRVLFVIPYFHDAWEYGGQPRSAYELAKGLVACGHSVTVLTTDSGGKDRLSGRGSIEAKHLVRYVDEIEIHQYRNVSNHLAFYHRLFWPYALFSDLDNSAE